MMSKWPNNPESVPHKTDYFLFGETENKTLQSWCCHPHFLILELCFFLYKYTFLRVPFFTLYLFSTEFQFLQEQVRSYSWVMTVTLPGAL